MSAFFFNLLAAADEEAVARLVAEEEKRAAVSWHPLLIGRGDGASNESNYSVIENQQSSPIGALIEKITNSIDAILLRRCYEEGLDPKAPAAPRTMNDAVERFFSPQCKNWHLPAVRRSQAESIQIVATGSKTRPCLLIYDDGEGQHPAEFERTFLSILRGNKNEIPFVQGKYNMGGTGAIVFCGRLRYQLVASRRYDGSGELGFTLVRRHPLTAAEETTRKNTWYEFLKIDGKVPQFWSGEFDVGLSNRRFKTGTLIKLFDYDLPQGTRGALPQEPRRAIDQHLFEPALPICLVDTPDRYPNNTVLQIDGFGLKRRLENDNKYVEKTFSITSDEHDIGSLKITCYVFRTKVDGQEIKKTRENIQRDYFHDGMAVLFALNGQVHGHFSSEFITRALEMQLLKHHLLIHIDCTKLHSAFRNELFMASRDRLKAGDETTILRKRVAAILRKSELVDIYNQRKNAISVEGGDAQDLLRAFSKNLPFNKDLVRLLNQTFKIEQPGDQKPDKTEPPRPKVQKVKEPFHPKRYPSFFKLKRHDGNMLITLPERDEKTVQFATDAEDSYFDRVDDPGDLKISILQFRRNDQNGGTEPGPVEDPGKLLDIRKASPKDGTIRLGLGATDVLRTGDELEVQAMLGGPEDIESRFWVKIVDATAKPKEVEKDEPDPEPPMGLPKYILVYQTKPESQPNAKSWDEVQNAGIEMNWDTVMHPFVEDLQLSTIYVNMDSRVLRSYKTRLGNLGPEQAEVADKRYISSVYFHAIFLYSITKSRQYEVKRAGQDTDLADYLREVFSSPYSDFLLNFGMDQLIQSLGD
jgi:hypothetical protein